MNTKPGMVKISTGEVLCIISNILFSIKWLQMSDLQMIQQTFGEYHRPDSTFNYLKNASYTVRFLRDFLLSFLIAWISRLNV